ncbi:MAG TPA: phosphoenolpyruvate carboxylase [Vicinamibacterales bacterium]|nr:phosphoenolpyruvate carboxylase [Vicinamibacterales bacterium]
MASFDDDPDAPLRADVSLLGTLLGNVIRAREGEGVFETVEVVRGLAKAARGGDRAAFEQLRTRVLGRLPLEGALPVARAFAHFLTLANIAEQHHRIRRRRHYLMDPAARLQPGSLAEAFPRLLAAGVPAGDLRAALDRLSIGLVLTAHPTEVARRTILLKHNRLAALLAERDRPDLTPAEREENLARLDRIVQELWETDEVRRDRLSPLDEVRWGLAVFEQTLWDALPRYLRALDRASRTHLGAGLGATAAPLRFGSWMGGDRDGNPNVTADVTWRTCLMARWVAAGLYLREVDALRSELSLGAASADLRARAGGEEREPYRALLRQVAARLRATQTWVAGLLEHATPGDPTGPPLAPAPPVGPAQADPLLQDEELRDALDLCSRSLVETGNQVIAEGRLLDLRRRVATFGLVLARLDVRQDAAVHEEAMEAIVSAGGEPGSWRAWDEERRLAFLRRYVAGDARLNLDVDGSGEVLEALETFKVMARIPGGSLGAYVVTMASRPSDVLGVLALQRAAGVDPPLRVVPLLETGRDLEAAGAVIRSLLAVPEYREAIDGRQEVMVGYSDSSKDIGRFSAGWLLYRAQEEIVRACSDAGVRLTIFHGRGGSVGRGGGPTHLAIRSLPPGAVDASLRVTEQGEMIQAHWGLPDLAVRTLEVYTTATLEATLLPGRAPSDAWRDRMDGLAAAARASYRGVVHDHPRFVDYFRAATPEAEIGRLHIGSRPARRSPGRDVGSLRAIPWQFAWTQTRLLLASWLGLEEALRPAAGAGDGSGAATLDELCEMYREWPYFRVLLDLMEMVLAKADPLIASEYDRRLVPPDLLPLGEDLRERLSLAITRLLAATGHERLLEENRVLRRSIAVRNPYVDPINLLQVELLSRLRAGPEAGPVLWTAFAITVNGIAAGMRNTG